MNKISGIFSFANKYMAYSSVGYMQRRLCAVVAKSPQHSGGHKIEYILLIASTFVTDRSAEKY